MNRKKVSRFLLLLGRDFLILMIIGNVLSLFTIDRELWTLKLVLNNCLFSIGIGYPAWKGMVFITMMLERKLPWLKHPIKRMIYQVLALFIFFMVLFESILIIS